MSYIILVFRELFLYIFLSDNSEEGTPSSIPNLVVKLFSAENSESEDRTLLRIFFVQKYIYNIVMHIAI